MSLELEELEVLISEKNNSSNLSIEGPVYTEYGFGWMPTISYWLLDRRVHLYWEITSVLMIEIATRNPDSVYMAVVADNSTSPEETFNRVWTVVSKFLVEELTVLQIPDFNWEYKTIDCDKFIPHPPNQHNPGNISQLVDVMKEEGEKWYPPKEG